MAISISKKLDISWNAKHSDFSLIDGIGIETVEHKKPLMWQNKKRGSQAYDITGNRTQTAGCIAFDAAAPTPVTPNDVNYRIPVGVSCYLWCIASQRD